MAYIEVRTAQNIVLRYELASVTDRILAFIVDLLITGFFSSIIGLVVRDETFKYLLLVPMFFLYHLLFELFFNGQSPGKRLLKIRVIDLSGETFTVKAVIIRWALRLIDIGISFSSVAILCILGSNKNQRLGDVLANTGVIKISRQHHVQLESLESLNNLDHNVQYPKVIRFSEEDILLIKEAIEHHQSFQSEESTRLLFALRQKVIETLEIPSPKNPNTIGFLRDVLKDYVFLTR